METEKYELTYYYMSYYSLFHSRLESHNSIKDMRTGYITKNVKAFIDKRQKKRSNTIADTESLSI